MKDYYEQLWAGLPDELAPPDFSRRREFLLSELRTGDRALDVGCGTGVFTAELERAGARAVGMEISESALERATADRPRLDFRLAPIDGPLPLEDCSFDLVWASEVIEHVADTARWLSEIRRVLAPKGRLLLTTPHHARLAIALRGVEPYADPLGDHLHLYTRRSLASLLGEFGFSAVRVRMVGGAPLLRRSLMARAVR
jgi:SAM-dependent methyltransferase